MTGNKEKILERVREVSDGELDNLIQQSETEIVNYRFSIRNYNNEKMAVYGVPFLARLESFQTALMSELERRTG